jgi:hypothetical protein
VALYLIMPASHFNAVGRLKFLIPRDKVKD